MHSINCYQFVKKRPRVFCFVTYNPFVILNVYKIQFLNIGCDIVRSERLSLYIDKTENIVVQSEFKKNVYEFQIIHSIIKLQSC